MKSNYLKSVVVEEESTAVDESEENKEPETKEKTAEELAEEKRERIASAMHRARHAAISFMSLSCEAIYEIH